MYIYVSPSGRAPPALISWLFFPPSLRPTSVETLKTVTWCNPYPKGGIRPRSALRGKAGGGGGGRIYSTAHRSTEKPERGPGTRSKGPPGTERPLVGQSVTAASGSPSELIFSAFLAPRFLFGFSILPSLPILLFPPDKLSQAALQLPPPPSPHTAPSVPLGCGAVPPITQ